MEGDEFRELVEDIAKNGQQQPILTYEGKVLDGRNRYRACVEAGVEPWTERWFGPSPVEAVLSLNLHRRHLTSGQRAVIASRMMPHLEAEAKKRRTGRPKQGEKVPERIPEVPAGEARQQAAKLTQTNPRYVSDAKRLAAEDPEAFGAVERGEKTLPEAMKPYRKPKAEAPKPNATNGKTPEGGAGPELDLPPFDLPEERRVYRKIITNLKDISKLDNDRIVGFCKGKEEAEKEIEHLSALIDELSDLRSRFEGKRREYTRGNLKAVN